MLSIALAVILSVAAAVIGLRAAAGDVTTGSSDAARTGWDRNEPGLGPDSLVSSDFGQIFLTKLKGSIYAQPLSVGGTLIVTTEDDQVYGIDPGDGSVKWHRDMGPAWPASALTCGDLIPNIGSTSAPVYDGASNSIYLTTKVNDGADVQHPHWYMHAVDPGSGAERPGWPVTIAGSPSNDPSTPFNPMTEHQRASLLLLNGVVYAGFGSHCDHGMWRGYIAGVSTSGAKMVSLWTSESGASNRGAGVWQAGGGLVSDGAGRIFFSTGNGVIPPKAPGNTPPGTLGESVVRLQAKAGQPLAVADFFSPANAPDLETNDRDLGSGGPMALPGSFGVRGHRHLLVQQGKDGRVFLLDRDRLGGRMQAKRGGDAVLGVVGPFQGQWGHPAAWTSDGGGYVYFADNGGPLRALKSGVTGRGLPALSLVGTSADTFPFTSGSPVVTSDGGKTGSGVVWVVWANGSSGGAAQLRAYSAIPDAKGSLPLLYSAPIGTASKFSMPATDGNRVFVGTRDGYIMGFGRPAKAVLNGSPVDFGSVAVGTTTSKSITLTATKNVQVNSVSTQAPFTVTVTPPVTLPVTLKAGDKLTLPVSYSPSAPGAALEILSVGTDSGTFGFSLNGFGTQPGLSAAPTAATFTDQPVGTTATVSVQITNTGSSPEKINSVTGPAAPFSAAGLAWVYGVLQPGTSLVFDVTYAPKASSNSDKSSVVITSTSTSAPNTTRKLTIPLTGNAVSGSGKLVLTPANVDFGSLATGSSRTLSFDITNAGNRAVTITKAKAPISDFTSKTPLAEGTVIGAGQVIHQSVTFTPSKVGLANGLYEFTGDAGQGAMTVPLTGVGTGTVPAPDASNWSANSSATVSGGTVQLTPAAQNKVGSAFYTTPVRTDGLHATFTAAMNGGTGGDGLTFSMLDPSKDSSTSVGGAGSGAGFAGLHGIAVALVTTQNTQANSSNFVGITVGTGGSSINYLATAAVPTSLRTGSHPVDVQVTGGHIKVAIDGTALLDTAVPTGSLPVNAIAGFTGATDGLTDVHTVSNVSISTVAGAGAPLTANPVSVDFGDIQVGSTGTATLTLDNKSSQPETVSAVTAPGAPFSVNLPAVDATLPPGSSTTVPVSFKPTSGGTFTGSLKVTTTSGSVVVPITGNGLDVLPDILTSTWSYAGFTTLAGHTATLTKDGQKSGAGSLVNSIAVSPLGVHARFTAEISGSHATGADGMTFALLDASVAKPGAIGLGDRRLGVGGLPAIFAALDTYDNTGINSHNFAAIGTSTIGATALNFLQTTTAIPALRTGTHQIDVTVTKASHMVLNIDGKQVLDVAVTLPPKVLVAFTAGVGGLSDTHAVLNPTISYTSK